jgi:type IV secretion system protein VirB3
MTAFPNPGAVPGFAVPLHRSLTEPILLGGVPRGIAIALGTLSAAVGLGLQLWLIGIGLYGTGHVLALWLTRMDPQFPSVFARHVRHRALLDA